MTHERTSNGPRIFDSREARDQWQIQTYGKVRNGWREPGEPNDGRPLIRRDSFWDSAEQQDAYEGAARKVLRMPDFEELPLEQKLGLIIAASGEEINLKRSVPVADMPKVKPMSTAAYNKRMEDLRAQARGMTVPPVEDLRLPRERETGEEG